MAAKKENKAPSLEELQAQLAEAEAEKEKMEQRLADAKQAGADALAQKEAAEQARAEAEKARADAETAKAASEKIVAGVDGTMLNVAPPGTKNMEAFDVYCKIPAGMTFPLPDGRKIKLAGLPLARIMDSAGFPLPGSGYGKTTVAADDWLYIRKTWGSLPAFKASNPVIFARAVGTAGDDQALEQASVTTGFEQIKVDGKDKAKNLKTKPAQK